MNEFDYALKLEKIQKAKTQKAIKEILEPLPAEVKEDKLCNAWGRGVESIYSAEKHNPLITMYYHIFRIGVDNYTGVGLQDYLRNSLHTLEYAIVQSIKDGKLTYEDFMEAFKYTKYIDIRAGREDWKNIIGMVDNNKLPCRIKYDFYTSRSYDSLFNDVETYDEPIHTNTLMELEGLRREYGRDDLTVLNELRNEWYSKYLKGVAPELTELQSKTIDNLRIDLNTVMQETERRLNEQVNSVQDSMPEVI